MNGTPVKSNLTKEEPATEVKPADIQKNPTITASPPTTINGNHNSRMNGTPEPAVVKQPAQPTAITSAPSNAPPKESAPSVPGPPGQCLDEPNFSFDEVASKVPPPTAASLPGTAKAVAPAAADAKVAVPSVNASPAAAPVTAAPIAAPTAAQAKAEPVKAAPVTVAAPSPAVAAAPVAKVAIPAPVAVASTTAAPAAAKVAAPSDTTASPARRVATA